jgi:hypothetical protein
MRAASARCARSTALAVSFGAARILYQSCGGRFTERQTQLFALCTPAPLLHRGLLP